MIEKTYKTPLGNIHYWTNIIDKNDVTLIFLPGLLGFCLKQQVQCVQFL